MSSIGRSIGLRLREASAAGRVPFVLASHAVLIVLANYLAWSLRFDGTVPPEFVVTMVGTLPWLLGIRLATFVPFGLYGGLWRYTGVWDLWRILLAVFTSSLLLYVLVVQRLGPAVYPRSIGIIDSVLLVCFLGGVRLIWRLLPGAILRPRRGRRVLIVGAGDAGEMIVREMRRGASYQPVGFIDNDPAKVGRTIHGVTVLGTADELPRVLLTTRPAEVLIAIPSAGADAIRSLVRQLEPFKLPITTLPSLSQIVNGTVGVKQIRPLAIEDLLSRSQIPLSPEDARQLIRGKRILVTGAGGSIGSELCRQIAVLEPATLILYERYENSLYAIANDLADRNTACAVRPIIGDITDTCRVDAVFAEHRPEIIFHAAAHKHVPLMEANPCEAVKNNVTGTRTVAEAAQRHGVELFVLISTDKAANPANVMGATKRVAELVTQAMSAHGTTRFATVRFGNVLGSNGSVIPRMVDQIRAGGPVTVTHPEIQRYFMLIPEAVQLVLRAAVLAHGRETFVLDMGTQLRVLDVARNLIRLCGFVPEEEIPITFVGLRPGEKLVEELVGDGETLEAAGTDKIFRVKWPALDTSGLRSQVDALIRAALAGRSDDVVRHLGLVVPNFRPAGSSTHHEIPPPVMPRPRKAALAPLSAAAAAASVPVFGGGSPDVFHSARAARLQGS
jgi:FlaA1/EpsC-like NDP-sugar epimerase